jgi:hypothetical protein
MDWNRIEGNWKLVQITAIKTPELLEFGVMQFKLLHVKHGDTQMYWSTPTLLEICIGLEINGYLPAEF